MGKSWGLRGEGRGIEAGPILVDLSGEILGRKRGWKRSVGLKECETETEDFLELKVYEMGRMSMVRFE